MKTKPIKTIARQQKGARRLTVPLVPELVSVQAFIFKLADAAAYFAAVAAMVAAIAGAAAGGGPTLKPVPRICLSLISRLPNEVAASDLPASTSWTALK